MHEIGLEQVVERVSEALNEQKYEKAAAYLWPAVDQYPENPALWFLAGNLLHREGRIHLALLAFWRSLELEYNPIVLVNIGATYRRLSDYDNGIAALKRALEDMPDHLDALVNVGAMYVNEGRPHEGIGYLERAMQVAKATNTPNRASWNLSLLKLEAGEFAEGFDLYRTGVHSERASRSYAKPTPGHEAHAPEPLLYQPDMPRAGKSIILWGEQGIGDELMFGTVIEDARAEFGEVILECHPRLEWLHRQAHPGMRVYPTRKDDVIRWPVEDGVVADYKLPLGDLAGLYRRDRSAFSRAWAARGPFYSADSAEVVQYRERLEALASGRPIVGLAMRGGTFQTARQHRSLSATEARGLIEATDAYFVCLDYEDMGAFSQWIAAEVGANRYGYFPAVVIQGGDYHHDGALAAACDMVVTVCQSIAHLSAAMGLNTRVLTPKRVAWRYGCEGEEWFWYPHDTARLYRQTTPDSWEEPIARVILDIKGLGHGE